MVWIICMNKIVIKSIGYVTVVFISVGRYIPASQRPDGTWRKARRVKDGYVPQEEVPLYESKGKQFMKKPAIPVGMCPIVAQEAKLKRERQQAKLVNPIPGLMILPSTKKSQNTVKSQNESGTSASKKSTTKSKAKKTGDASASSAATTKTSTSNDVKCLNSAMNSLALTPDDDIAKKLKKLRKKVREIEAIESKLSSGELKKPEQDQLDKISRKTEILDELIQLEKLERSQWNASESLQVIG